MECKHNLPKKVSCFICAKIKQHLIFHGYNPEEVEFFEKIVSGEVKTMFRPINKDSK